MLKLKRVELQGFKSFCERTEMRFHGTGLAAVVGPNGCGKSNLSDAISWVLGEQSAKTLRGSRMEDVIFAGTRERKALSMASVTMTLIDPNHVDKPHLPVEVVEVEHNGANGHSANGSHPPKSPHEITITRRLYRDATSEYLIDGKQARLRDIQDLFIGTGLGPESYAIIEQGRIGLLLSSKPYDRRAVIEEAAGIGKFKTKRRLAEAKLESAKQNLSRVFDILEEVGRQANSLKRQAAKARRYQELHAELIVQLKTALVGKYRFLERDAAKVALDLNEANSQYQALAAQVADQEKARHEILEAGYAIEAELTATREALAGRRVEAERISGKIESQAREVASMEARMTQSEADSLAMASRQETLQGELQAHGLRLAELEEQAEEARGRLDQQTRERDSLQAALVAHTETMETARQEALRLLGEVASLNNQLAQMEGYFQSLDRDRSRLAKEEQMAMADLERLEERKKEVGEALVARQLELESISDRRNRVEDHLGARRTEAAETRRHLEEIRTEASRFKARKDSLEEILSHRAYTTESVKRLFTALEHGQAEHLKPSGVLADFVEVDAAFEKAAEEFLHDELEYVIVKDWSQADRGIDFMRTDLDGRATFLVHPEPGANLSGAPATEPAIGPETGIVSRLSDVLRLTNGLTQAPASLVPRLARCFFAEDRAAAQRLSTQYPDLYFLLKDGVCYHGHAVSGGRKTASGPLGLKRELRELTAVSAARQKAVEEAAHRLGILEEEIRTSTAELESLRGEQQSREREALALDHEARKLAEEFSRANSRLSVSRLELQRIQREGVMAAERREAAAKLVEEKEARREIQEGALAAARAASEEFRQRVATATEGHSVLRIEMAERDERRRSERNAQQALEAQFEDLLRRRGEIATLISSLGAGRQRLLVDNMELDDLAEKLAREIEAEEGKVSALAAGEQSIREKLAAMEEAVGVRRAEAQAMLEKRAQIEVNLVERRAEIKYLDETAQKELKAGLEQLASGEETVPGEVELLEAEEKCAALKAKIENLGPVNADALGEYEEAQQRYDFLNTQRQDLLDSIRDTEKAIQDLDVESKRRFTEAFTVINENFKETFTKLFSGGMAEMRLTGEQNVSESGIDIIASPPGKRLQNVLLLSGGEKALTALSLLMAIFRYTPSPFCILDEVDAPLDEPNIQRLMGLLKEMSETTQFIMITHAKRTMESASSLYGVTMQEPGVSKLVTVRFNPVPGGAATGATVLAGRA